MGIATPDLQIVMQPRVGTGHTSLPLPTVPVLGNPISQGGTVLRVPITVFPLLATRLIIEFSEDDGDTWASAGADLLPGAPYFDSDVGVYSTARMFQARGANNRGESDNSDPVTGASAAPSSPTGGGTLLRSWNNETNFGMFTDVESGVTISTNTAKNYQGQARNLIATYQAGVAGVNGDWCMADITDLNLTEVYVEFKYRFQRYVNCKFCKFHGIPVGGTWSNMTVYARNDARAALGYGDATGGPNDTQIELISNGVIAGGSSTPRSTPNFVRTTANDVWVYNDTWRHARVRVKFSKTAPHNGEVEVWEKAANVNGWVDSDKKFHVTNLINQQENATYIERWGIFDYSNGSQMQDGYLMFADIKLLSGGWSEAESLTATDTSQILFHANFNNATVGQTITSVTGNKLEGHGVVSSDRGYGGSNRSIKMTALPSNAGSENYLDLGFVYENGFPQLFQGDECWLRVALYIPSPYDFKPTNTGRLKFMRFHTNHGDGSNHGSTEVLVGGGGNWQHILEFDDVWHDIATSAFTPIQDRWEVWEMHHYFHTSSSLGKVDFYKDGNLAGSITVKTLNDISDYMDKILFQTIWNGGVGSTQIWYVGMVSAAVKKAGGRDDSSWLSTHASGRKYIGV